MTNETVFVTGGSGYVGRNLIRGLVAAGHRVVALARSEASAAVVAGLGATAARGDVLDGAKLPGLIAGAQWLVHAAADTGHGLSSRAQDQTNLDGTRAVFSAARQVGVKRAVQVSTESVLLGGKPLRNATEAMPIPAHLPGGYSRTKAAAEEIALATASPDFAVMAVRPRFVWGRDDTTALPALIEAARSGRLQWIDGGDYLTSTTHVANAVHGIQLCLARGRSGEAYFLSDGAPIKFRDFVTALLATQNVSAPTGAVPGWLVRSITGVGEAMAALTGGAIKPPISAQELATIGVEVTLDISKATRELGYAPVISRTEGLAELTRKIA